MTAFSSLMLVFVTAAVALGLAAVVAAFDPMTQVDETGTGGAEMAGSEQESPLARAAVSSAPVQPIASAEPFAPVGQIRDCRDGDCKSPLYPQHGVTLWDRIRSSAKGDQRANLLGTGIQIHAPSTAATPGPVQTRQYGCSSNKLCELAVTDESPQQAVGD